MTYLQDVHRTILFNNLYKGSFTTFLLARSPSLSPPSASLTSFTLASASLPSIFSTTTVFSTLDIDPSQMKDNATVLKIDSSSSRFTKKWLPMVLLSL
ncbi:hypothetical protein L6452_39367 [Arctium lappa]|uniref:Uncharacterized protein n=1 Tax=Arctium lappa TaxID=4217 RepID=A0ACB8XT07_ARCLA|nr:hypothetical protein L6452_39367 [Arctium lappa]